MEGLEERALRSVPLSAVASVLLVADPSAWRDDTVLFLEGEGFGLVVADGADGVNRLAFMQQLAATDIAVVDLGLAGLPGAAVCATIRSRSAVPILALDRVADEPTMLGALAAGADHFAPRGVSTRELLARMRALLRRFPPRRARADAVATAPEISLDPVAPLATVGGRVVPLVGAELAILRALLDRPGRVVTRHELAGAARLAVDRDRSLDLVMRRLREKLEAVQGGRRIVTVRGIGFRLELGDPETQT